MKIKEFILVLSEANGQDLINHLDTLATETQKQIVDYVVNKDFDYKTLDIIKIDEIIKKITLLKNPSDPLVEKVKAVRSTILTQSRGDSVEKMVSLLEGFTDARDRINLLEIVKRIPPEQRTALIEQALPFFLFPDGTHGHEEIKILGAIRDMLSTERADVCAKALPFMQGIPRQKYSNRGLILLAISAIPREERNTEVISAIVGLFANVMVASKILEIIFEIPQTERANVIGLAQPLMKSLTGEENPILSPSHFERANILKAVEYIPRDQRNKSVISAIVDLFGHPRALYQILDTIRKIPQTEIADVIRMAQPLMNNIRSERKKATILRAVNLTPHNERTGIIDLLLHVLGNFNHAYLYAAIEAIESIPLPLRNKEVLSALLWLKDSLLSQELFLTELLRGGPLPKETIDFIVNVRGGSPLQKEIIDAIVTLFTTVDDEEERVKMLMAIERTPEANRVQMVVAAAEFRERVEDNFEMIDIMETLSNFPAGKFDEVLKIFKENSGF